LKKNIVWLRAESELPSWRMCITENMTERMYFNEESNHILNFYAYQHKSLNAP